MLMRFLLRLEYDGSAFSGWQRQGDVATVQQTLELAACRLEGGKLAKTVIGAGRTDAGVHALGQAAHLDMVRAIEPNRLCAGLNALVRPSPLSVLEAQIMPPDFHARFDAISRRYAYIISDKRSPPALERGRIWHFPTKLDVAAMNEAAKSLTGRHDFTTFRDSMCQAKSPIRTLDAMEVRRVGQRIYIVCAARSFLHRQVRSMVGSLVEIGRGRWPVARLEQALAATDRSACGPVAPAHGLYLVGIDYPKAAK